MKSKCDAVRPLLGGAALLACCAVAADVVVENDDFRLVAGDDACVRSLVVKATGEECVDASLKAPLLSVTQDRPFDNELKLIHPNKRIVYPANSLRREGDLLVFGFAHGMYGAAVRLKVAPRYVAFTLEDFPFERKGSYTYLRMDVPQARSCRFLQLPAQARKNFGDWLNACWDDRAAVCVAGTSPHPDIDHEDRPGAKILYAEALAGVRLRGASAAILAAPGREAFLDAMDSFERDFGLPRGVRSRRSDAVREPIFHLSGDYSLAKTDEVVELAKKGGFRLVTMSYHNLFKSAPSWGLCGNYDWRDDIPGGEADVRAALAKFHAAGIPVGLIIGYMASVVLFPVITGSFTSIPCEIYPDIRIFAAAALFSWLTVWIGCIRPYRMIKRISPVEAVRYSEYTGEKLAGKRKTKKVTPLVLAWENLKRSKRKTIVVILSISLSIIMINVTVSITESFDKNLYIRNFAAADFTVSDGSMLRKDLIDMDYEGVSVEDIEHLSGLDGLTDIGAVYMSESWQQVEGKALELCGCIKHGESPFLFCLS